MYKHTITRVRPNADVQWPYQVGGAVIINKKYDLTSTDTESEDGLTRTVVRESANSSVFTSIENDLADSSSDLYWITEHCLTNGITSTSTIENV
jgi:hypothetical protein